MLLRRAAPALLAAALAGCGATVSSSGPVNSGARLEAGARRAASELAVVYERAQIEDFNRMVDQSTFPDYSDFTEQVREFLLKNHQITLSLIVDKTLSTGDLASVSTHWNKSFVDEKGQSRLANGECELLFRPRASGGLALVGIRGDSPF